ncbi:hypothetical protein BXY57_2088 [Thermoflavifilum aggregans]|uniref:Uncharacterized protein n=1 Tax=Thermoflavifilum aggregans TaxID=454188 RepID=A0A2M9CXD1_9BACT|nr:hypothetical protein [Thermoflavifilum aggregans]PJJ76468.1 hypothetical protein BXY57_2088 [Thermoflavifilum aggregans]
MSSNIRLQKTCQYCGNRFTAKTTVTQFCSDTCVKRAYKPRKRNEKIEVAIKEETEKALYNPAIAQQEYHFPVKIALSSTVEGMLDDMNLVEQLIYQAYQLSRMYWKSISQQNLPDTKHPEMVAEIFPHFEHNHLPGFSKQNLWFL